MKVGFFQMEPELLNVEGNVDKALKALEKVETDLIVLPELFNSGYAFKTKELRRLLVSTERCTYFVTRRSSLLLEMNFWFLTPLASWCALITSFPKLPEP